MAIQTPATIFETVATTLHETFEIDRDSIKPSSRLYEDLDIDSIDAIDLIVRLKPLVGKRLDPEVFKSVRTVQDVVDALHGLMHEA